MADLSAVKAKWHGVPVGVWAFGVGIVLVLGAKFVLGRKAGASSTTPTTVGAQPISSDSLLPGMTGIGDALGAGTGAISSGTGAISAATPITAPRYTKGDVPLSALPIPSTTPASQVGVYTSNTQQAIVDQLNGITDLQAAGAVPKSTVPGYPRVSHTPDGTPYIEVAPGIGTAASGYDAGWNSPDHGINGGPAPALGPAPIDRPGTGKQHTPTPSSPAPANAWGTGVAVVPRAIPGSALSGGVIGPRFL